MSTLRMARCIGRVGGCDGEPNGGRGLCRSCYQRHRYNGTLGNFPTMSERQRALRKQGYAVLTQQSMVDYRTAWRKRKYRERIVINNTLVHPLSAHGQLHSYLSYGCRGEMCAAAQLYYRDTGETKLPLQWRGTSPTMHDCATFTHPRYGRKRSA